MEPLIIGPAIIETTEEPVGEDVELTQPVSVYERATAAATARKRAMKRHSWGEKMQQRPW
jgi:hypothetical protein